MTTDKMGLEVGSLTGADYGRTAPVPCSTMAIAIATEAPRRYCRAQDPQAQEGQLLPLLPGAEALAEKARTAVIQDA